MNNNRASTEAGLVILKTQVLVNSLKFDQIDIWSFPV